MATSAGASTQLTTGTTTSNASTLRMLDSTMDVLLELALPGSVRSFQMTYPSTIQLAVEMPMVRIPHKPKIFYGRDIVVETIAASLVGETAARFAVLGADGIGKTSVAAAVWHSQDVEKKYGSSRVWVSCDGIMSDEGLVPALAAAFNVPDNQRDQLRNRLLQYLKFRADAALVVLDNYHVPPKTVEEGADRTLLGELASIPHISLLFTTGRPQQPAGIEWSQLLLPPLDVSTARAVYLAHGGQEDDRLDEVLALLDGSPLAIVLGAKQSRALPAADLVRAYQHQKANLVGRSSRTPPTGLELAVSVTLDSQAVRNSPQALPVLSTLSLLPDGIEITQLPAVMPNTPDIEHAVNILEQLGLVIQWGRRLRAISAVRPFLLDQHPPIAENVKVLRFSLCAPVDNFGITIPDTATVGRVTKELGNITSVLSYELRNCNLDPAVLHSIHQLCIFKAHARYGDCKPLVMLAAQELERQQSSHMESQYLLIYLTCSLMAQKDWNDAAALLDQVNSTAIHPRLEATRLLLYAVLHMTQHRFEDTTKLLLQATASHDGNASLQAAMCTELLAGIAVRQGNLDEAQSRCAAAERYYTSIENQLGSYRCQELLANIFVEQSRHADAFRMFMELLHAYSDAGFDCGVSRLQRSLYRIHFLDGRYEAALTGYSAAKRKAQEAHDKFAFADCERGSARTYELMQLPAAALELYRVAVSLFQGLDEVIEVAHTRLDLGHCMCDAQLPADGLSQMSAAMAAFDYYGLKYPSAKCKQYSGKVLASLRAAKEGLSRLRAALGVFLELDHKIDAADCYITIAGICYSSQQLDVAEEATRSAMSLYETGGKPESKANCTVILASCYRQRGMVEDATRAAQEGLDILSKLDDRALADEGVVRMLKGFLASTHEAETDE